MEHDFWQERWATNTIAFHEAQPHPFLRAHIGALGLKADDAVFLPLCGKTLDIDWLLGQGFGVVGCELNEGAVEEVFARLEMTPQRDQIGTLQRLSAGALTIFIGDFFDLTADDIGAVAGLFDRGSLVALPEDMRRAYVPHLIGLAPRATHLTITYDYEQSQTQGPPFSVPLERVKALYGNSHEAKQLDVRAIAGPLAKRCSGEELAICLSPH